MSEKSALHITLDHYYIRVQTLDYQQQMTNNNKNNDRSNQKHLMWKTKITDPNSRGSGGAQNGRLHLTVPDM